MDADEAPKSEIVSAADAEVKLEPMVPVADVPEGAASGEAVTEAVTEEAVTDGPVTDSDTAVIEKESDETKPSNQTEKEAKEDTEGGDNAPEDIKPEPEGNKANAEDNQSDSKAARPGNVTPECLAKSDEAKPPETEVPDTDPFSDTNPSPEPAPTVSHPDTKVNQSPEPKEPATSSDPHPVPVPNAHRSGHHSRAGGYASLTLNQMAIAASAQNKLPTSRLKGILERLGRHTESSAKKRGAWYKSETSYVDINSYSWKNLALYKDYQQNMWTSDGAIKTTCKK
ncbi:neurofilament medium polypeptide-like [Haliotis asinina]|uniref:neurofilament medium polypeptide-like n=1 Tax=Haliotis asinina TaxID=109174 RepID=UPI00353239CA